MPIFKSRRPREAPVTSPETRGAVLVTPGRHIVDGKPVDVPLNGEQGLVRFLLASGRHIVDGRIAIVADPTTSPFPLPLQPPDKSTDSVLD